MVCLSGGPIEYNKLGFYLVACHIHKGGWGGIRMTFFYTFENKYPFKILKITPIICFGFSKKTEYCNQIFKDNNYIYISLGVDDKYSVLLKVNEKIIFNLLKNITL